MPIYIFKCRACKAEEEFYRSVDTFVNSVPCKSCGFKMRIKLTPPTLFVTDSRIKKAEIEAKRNGNIIREPGIAKDAQRAKEYQEEKTRIKAHKVAAQTVQDFVI